MNELKWQLEEGLERQSSAHDLISHITWIFADIKKATMGSLVEETFQFSSAVAKSKAVHFCMKNKAKYKHNSLI